MLYDLHVITLKKFERVVAGYSHKDLSAKSNKRIHEYGVTDSVTFCISNVFHNKYPFALSFVTTVTKGCSVVISDDATSSGES